MTTTKNEAELSAQYPDWSADPMPIEPCISGEYFEREREHIFHRVWLNIGREEEILKAGDYFVKDLAVSHASVIVVRGKGGVIHGFHNVCQHRGNRVIACRAGSTKGFTCGFHGWTYDLEGQLIHVPDDDQFYNLKKTDHGLVPVATSTWEGFIFVNLDPAPAETLQEHMAKLGQQLQGYPFHKMLPVACYSAGGKGELEALHRYFSGMLSRGVHSQTLRLRYEHRQGESTLSSHFDQTLQTPPLGVRVFQS